MDILKDKKVLLGVTGGIAAYKACELARLFRKAGAQVRAVMTPAACEFVTPLTLSALTGHETALEMFGSSGNIDHIELARWADLLVIAPATANTLAKIAHGIADNLLTSIALATTSPKLVAPAMNCAMYANQATGENLRILEARGVHIVGPDTGYQACGETGAGRMSEPDAIFRRAAEILLVPQQSHRMVVTAGPTEEMIDPVRCITNLSSGRMGYALAQAAAIMGWKVTLISGPVAIPEPVAVEVVRVRTAAEMMDAAWSAAKSAECFIGCAAVSDYRPQTVAPQKIKKSSGENLKLVLTENPDIVRTVAALDDLFTVGFAAETDNVLAYAREKLKSKGLDMIVANDVSGSETGFNSTDNAATVIVADGSEVAFDRMSKELLAQEIISIINGRIGASGSEEGI